MANAMLIGDQFSLGGGGNNSNNNSICSSSSTTMMQRNRGDGGLCISTTSTTSSSHSSTPSILRPPAPGTTLLSSSTNSLFSSTNSTSRLGLVLSTATLDILSTDFDDTNKSTDDTNHEQQQQQQQSSSSTTVTRTGTTNLPSLSSPSLPSILIYNNNSNNNNNTNETSTGSSGGGGGSPQRRALTSRKSVDFAIGPTQSSSSSSPYTRRSRILLDESTSVSILRKDSSLPNLTFGSSTSSLLLPSTSNSSFGYYIGSNQLPSPTNNNNNNNASNISMTDNADTDYVPTNTNTTTGTTPILPPVMNDYCWNAKQVVDAISTCICTAERMEAITNAIESLNHNNQELHNEEMSTGIDAAMTKHLTFLVYQYTIQQQVQSQQQQMGVVDPTTTSTTTQPNYRKEISLTFEAMESLYRASSQIVGVSFERMGNELLQIILYMINNELQYRRNKALRQQQSPTLREQVQRLSPPQYSLHPGSTNDTKVSSIHPMMLGTAMTLPPALLQVEEVVERNADVSNNNSVVPTVTTDTMINSTNNSSNGDDDEDDDCIGDLLLIKATKIIAHLARVANATNAIAHYPGLLGTLLNVCAQQQQQQPISTSPPQHPVRPNVRVPWEARLSALWTIANLACNPENMIMMVCFPNLIATLISVGNRQFTDDKEQKNIQTTMEILRSRSIACRAILNLSWAPENKILLSEFTLLLDLLCNLGITRTAATTSEHHRMSKFVPSPVYNKSKTIQEILVSTRRHAVGALRNIAAAPRRVKIFLCNYRNGLLLQTITDAALNDSDPVVKERAFGMIHNLANQDTAETIVNNPALVLALKDALLSTSSSLSPSGSHSGKTDDPDEYDPTNNNNNFSSDFDSQQSVAVLLMNKRTTPREHASTTITILERSITPSMTDAYEKLRTILDAIHPITSTTDPAENDNSTSNSSNSSSNDSSDGSQEEASSLQPQVTTSANSKDNVTASRAPGGASSPNPKKRTLDPDNNTKHSKQNKPRGNTVSTRSRSKMKDTNQGTSSSSNSSVREGSTTDLLLSRTNSSSVELTAEI